MSSLVPRPSLFPDLVRFLEAGWPFTTFGDRHLARIEDYRDNGNYVLRAELPGMDPQKDIHVSVEGNELAITAERTVEKHDKAHSESPTVRSPGRFGCPPGPTSVRSRPSTTPGFSR